jgi:hypothetical protein
VNKENNAPAAPNALQDFTSCPEWGSGGRFVYDPATKIRTRVEEAPAVPDESQAPGETAPAPKKERNRA